MFAITRGKGFHITFANGWTVSVQFGGGNYCDNYDDPIVDGWEASGAKGCSNAEIAAWPPGGDMHNFGENSVKGYVTPNELLAYLNQFAEMPKEED